MPYVHSVTSDEDELDNQEWEASPTERRPFPWIPIASAAGAVVLLVVLLVMLAGRGGSSPAPAGKGDDTNAVGTPLAATDPRVVAVQDALDAWGTFEGSGKIADLGDTMATDGPQYKALAARAGKVPAGTKPYVVVVTNPRLVADAAVTDGQEVVRADLIWKRDGKADKTVVWDLTVVPVDGTENYQLWTAKTVKASSTTTAAGGAAGASTFCDAAKQAAAVPTVADVNARSEKASSDDAKLAIVRDVLQQRADTMTQLANAAPNEIKAKAQTVATANAKYASLVKGAASLDALSGINKQFAKNTAYVAGEKARPDVQRFVQQQCGVDINPER